MARTFSDVFGRVGLGWLCWAGRGWLGWAGLGWLCGSGRGGEGCAGCGAWGCAGWAGLAVLAVWGGAGRGGLAGRGGFGWLAMLGRWDGRTFSDVWGGEREGFQWNVRKTFGRRSGDVRETFGRRSEDVRETFGRRSEDVRCGVGRSGAGCAGAGRAGVVWRGVGRAVLGRGWLCWRGVGLGGAGLAGWRCGVGLGCAGGVGRGWLCWGGAGRGWLCWGGRVRTCSDVFRTSLERLPNVLRIGAGSVFIAGSGKVAKLSGKVVVAVLEGLVCAMRRAARPFELLLVLALISRVLLAQCACRESGGQAVPLDTLDGPVLEVRLGGVLREALRAKRAYFGLLVIFVFDVVDKVREGIDAAARRARSLSLSPLSLSSTDSLTCSACFHVGFRWWR